jgi:deoxycytidylate deaminase
MCKHQHKLVATIFDKRGRVLSIGRNSYKKTHPLQAKHAKKFGKIHHVFIHAELDAILKCKNLKKAYKLFVKRINGEGKLAPAKPCEICMDVIDTYAPHLIIEHT